MVLGDVEETITTIEIDEETYEQIYRVSRPSSSSTNDRLNRSLSANQTTDSDVICPWRWRHLDFTISEAIVINE